MEFNNDTFEEQDSLQFSLNLRDQINKYIIYWKWFLFSLIVCFLFTLVKLNFTKPEYSTFSTIQILNTEGRERESQLTTFKDLGIDVRSNTIVEDEIEVIRSKRLLTQTIKKLNFNLEFFTEENTVTNFIDKSLNTNINFFKVEQFKNPTININFLAPRDSIYESATQFVITIKSPDKYSFVELKMDVEKEHSFGEKIQTSLGEIIITPNIDISETNFESKTLVKVLPLNDVVAKYAANLNLSQITEFSSIVNISVTGSMKEKSEIFLNTLIKIYNDESIESKDQQAQSTADFIETRLEKISVELSDVEGVAERFKQRNRLSDMNSEDQLNLQSGQALDNQLVDASTQLLLVQSVKDFISTKEKDEPIPLNLGFADNSVDEVSTKYNELILEKKRLLKSSTEKNPIVKNLSDEIATVKKNLTESLGTLENTKRISLDAITRQSSIINSKIYQAPRKERQFRDIQRQQQIKEALFLFILQKREESVITLGVSSPPSRIVNVAESYNLPVSPKPTMAFLAAIIMGAFIPFASIYLKNILDIKVHNKEDIERVLSIPILGDIPKLESKKSFLITPTDQSSIAEAFRILRTNLNFLLTKTSEKGKTIFITSTIAHEGKSLVASNLAASLSFTGKKTLMIGMDVRAPGIKSYLGIRGAKGVTNYIIDHEMSYKDIILKVPKVSNLDLISSGEIPPNPSELLMHDRVKELFEAVKKEYDYIIVDTAACSVVTDTMLLQEHADAFVYVIRANFLDKYRLKYIKSIYKDNRLPNMALLINGVDPKKSYGYGYGYGYGEKMEKKKTFLKKLFS